MIIGFDFFGYNDGVVFDKTTSLGKFNTAEIRNSIVDELYITEGILGHSIHKEVWSYDTVLHAKFTGDLEAGNINLAGQQIEFIKVRKRKIEVLNWQDVIQWEFSKDVQIYNHTDYFVEAGELYEYAIIPVAYGGFEGEYNIAEIECAFDGTWIVSKQERYRLFYNLDYGSITNVMSNQIFEPLGATYPIIVHNGNLNYKKGSIKSLLVSSQSEQEGDISVRQEKILRNHITQFLSDKKPKILKDGAGNYFLVSIVGNPELIANNSLNQKVYEISFEWVEFGDANNDKTLKLNGLL